MKINVLENAKNKLVFELEGSDETFCNALKDALRQDENVSLATYAINHPIVGKPKFFIETSKGASAKDALEGAISTLKDSNKSFLKAFENMK